jgi:hypothetical protein
MNDERRLRRRQKFQAVVQLAKDPEFDGEWSVSITRNGFQWDVISFLPEEAETLCATLKRFRESLK